MEFYETQMAEVGMDEPQQMSRMDEHQIIEYMRKHYQDRGIETAKPANKCTAYLMAVSDAVFNPDDWKSPIKAELPKISRRWVKAAILWYHATKPIENRYNIWSRGYFG